MDAPVRQVRQQILSRQAAAGGYQPQSGRQPSNDGSCIQTLLLQRDQPRTRFTFRQLLAVFIA